MPLVFLNKMWCLGDIVTTQNSLDKVLFNLFLTDVEVILVFFLKGKKEKLGSKRKRDFSCLEDAGKPQMPPCSAVCRFIETIILKPVL